MIAYSGINRLLAIEKQIFKIGFENEDIDLSPEWELTSSCDILGYNIKMRELAVDSQSEDSDDEEFDYDPTKEEPEENSNPWINFINFLNFCSSKKNN